MATPQSLPGPPYPSTHAALGGLPTNDIDTPIAAVMLALYAGAAAGHMTLFQLNNRRGHKFVLSGLMFGYCMSRILTMTLRIVWANYPTNVSVAIAANILVAAGVLLLYVVNVLFAQRLIRARHPTLGWHKGFSLFFRGLYALLPAMLVVVITVVVHQRYTLDQSTIRVDTDLQLMGQCYIFFFAFLPFPLMALNYLIPVRSTHTPEPFGRGHTSLKVGLLLLTTTLLVLGAGFRIGIGFEDYYHPRPLTNPGWYHSKAAFWVFDIVVELLVVYIYLAMRVDLRFHVADGSHKPGDYSRNLRKEESGGSGSAEELEKGEVEVGKESEGQR